MSQKRPPVVTKRNEGLVLVKKNIKPKSYSDGFTCKTRDRCPVAETLRPNCFYMYMSQNEMFIKIKIVKDIYM